MDFPTRDNYRKRIEKLARQSDADRTRRDAPRHRARAGCDGARPKSRAARTRLLPARQRAGDAGEGRSASALRLRDRGRGLFRALAFAATSAVCIVAGRRGRSPSSSPSLAPASDDAAAHRCFALLAVLPAIDLAATILSQRHPRRLPGRSRCRRSNSRTACRQTCGRWSVIPTLLSSPAAIEEVIGQLEIHYLANAVGRPHLRAAVGLDGRADRERRRRTSRCSGLAKEGIAELNRRPSATRRRDASCSSIAGGCGARRRSAGSAGSESAASCRNSTGSCAAQPTPRSSPIDGVAAERARRRPLRGHARFRHAPAARHRAPARRQDGPRPQPAAHRPAAQAASSRATAFCSRASRWRCRMASEGSWFQRVFSGATGMDPYAAPVSDVYQDLFGEGSFIGKGIYDVDAFEAAMEGRAPENAILSHDLFEGIFARAGPRRRRRDRGGVPAPLRRGGIAPASLGAGRLAASALAARAADGGRQARRRPPRCSAAGRCSTISAARCRRRSAVAGAARWLAAAAGRCLIWTRVRARRACRAGRPAGRCSAPFTLSPRSSWRGHFATCSSDL